MQPVIEAKRITKICAHESKALDEVSLKVNKGEAITAVGTTAIIEAAYSEGVVGIAT